MFVWNKLFKILSLRCCLGSVILLRENRDLALVELSLVEVNYAISKSIQSVILTLSNILAYEVLVATLTNNDVTGRDFQPPQIFTPKRFEADSRPLRELV